ncbi:MAG: TlpA disulfide reductase family protein [Candidatus Acidiferrales bacterium]
MLILLAGAAMTGCRQRPAPISRATQAALRAGEIGSQLPDFTMKDLSGRDISSASFRGQVVLVDFWATWCQPCKKEMPGYQKLADRYHRQGFAVIGLKSAVMADTENPERFARRIGVRYPLVVATDDLAEKFGPIQGLPTTMLYDRHGVLRYKVIGFEYTKVIEAEIQRLL